jgi:hypothetical protein
MFGIEGRYSMFLKLLTLWLQVLQSMKKNRKQGCKLTEKSSSRPGIFTNPSYIQTLIGKIMFFVRQDMLKIRSEEFPTSKIELTKNLAGFSVAAFKMKFGSCLKAWRKYPEILKTSTFIMSEKFKLSIRWVIKFLTIDRIRAGELGVHEEKIETEPEELTEKLTQHMESPEETEPCKKLRYGIAKFLKLLTLWLQVLQGMKKNREQGCKLTEKSSSRLGIFTNPSYIQTLIGKIMFFVRNNRIIMEVYNSFFENRLLSKPRNFYELTEPEPQLIYIPLVCISALYYI